MQRFFFLSLLLLLPLSSLSGQCPYQLLVSAEGYFMDKVRDTGTKQEGDLGGYRVTLQRLQSDKIYLAADYLSATGTMEGYDHRDRPLLSTITDTIFEGRLGYCFPAVRKKPSFFAPFIGWGHFNETSLFHPPSPLLLTYTDTFQYTVAGFLSGYLLGPRFELGMNFKVMFMHNATSTIHDPDPEFGDITLLMRNVPYFRVELPLTFALSQAYLLHFFRISPFYEYRHFGGRAGSPFDFHDTQFNLYGMTTSLIFTY